MYENDIRRALNFVLDLRSRIDVPVTAGLTYYIAHAGYLGSVMCEDYTCYGWGVNLASRFMTSAPVGEIWVDDRIAGRVSNRFLFEFIGEQRFKGFSANQRVHRLKSYNHDVEAVYVGEMIGRDLELARLEKFVEPLWKGDFAGMLLILGDAGIGKGRLVQGFRASRLFEEQDATWALCQSEQILRQSFNPFRSWLFRYFKFTSSQGEAERRQLFDAKIDDLVGSLPGSEPARELDRLRSVLGALVDLFWENSLYEQSDAEALPGQGGLYPSSQVKAEHEINEIADCLRRRCGEPERVSLTIDYSAPNDVSSILTDFRCDLKLPSRVQRDQVVQVLHRASVDDESMKPVDCGVRVTDYLTRVVDRVGNALAAECAEIGDRAIAPEGRTKRGACGRFGPSNNLSHIIQIKGNTLATSQRSEIRHHPDGWPM